MFGGRIRPSTIDSYITAFQGATLPNDTPEARWINFLAQQTGKLGSRTYLENEFLKSKGFTGTLADMITQWVVDEDGLRTEMSSTNLITNGDFEVNTTGWTTNNVTISSSTTSPYRGSRCLAAVVTSVATNPAVLQNINTTVGKTYSFSVYVKAVAGDLFYVYADGLSGAYNEMTSNGTWQKLSIVGVSSYTPAALEIGIAKATTAVNDNFYIDAVTLKLNR